MGGIQSVSSQSFMWIAFGFAALIVADFRDAEGCMIHFVGDTIALAVKAGLRLYNEAVLVEPVGTMPMRAAHHFPRTLKLLHGHQNVLIFVKGDPDAARRAVQEGRE